MRKRGNLSKYRALKVSEYLNINNLDEYYLLTADGKALYRQQGHEEWAKEVMLETWQEHAKGVGTKVKVDCP
jgi:hypothetical protein